MSVLSRSGGCCNFNLQVIFVESQANNMSCFAELKYFLFEKISSTDDATSRVFLLYMNKFSLKQGVLEKIRYHNSRAS